MAILGEVITQEAQSQFNSDMERGYAPEEYERYRGEAGWQEWMNDYTDASDGEECTERELNNIDDVQRIMWDAFWKKAGQEINKAEREYRGDFVAQSQVHRKDNDIYVYTFELNGVKYEYTDREYNGEYYHGWNVETKEDVAVRPVALEVSEDEYIDLGYVICPWNF